MLSGVADSVWVLSLPGAKERRARLPGHLAEFGITEFNWHDAFSPDAPEVTSLYDRGLVHQFPPCFQCGALRCDDDTCNNVIIPAQVANFAGFQALWKKIAATPQRALILEDDVLFHPWAPRVFRRLARLVETGRLSLAPSDPRLLRLGWALGKDHRWFKRRFRIKTRLRMSNPCHLITSAYAAALLERFERIDTTSDVFIHRDAPRTGEALTIFPPVASELSWSVGSLDSDIHPKAVRLEYLETQASPEAQRREIAARIERHVSHIFARPLLFLGHPAAGPRIAAEHCGRLGLDVGHETLGEDGISTWALAVDDMNPDAQGPGARKRRALHWDVMIQVLRDPATAVPSIMREDARAPVSYDFRRRHILAETGIDLDGFESGIDRAVASLCLWHRIIAEQSPAFVFRVESGADALKSHLTDAGVAIGDPGAADASPLDPESPEPDEEPADWTTLSDSARALLVEYCNTYGYQNPAVS